MVCPVVFVNKKDGTQRFCIDYRKLNDVTKKDSYPLPRIDLTLDSLGGSKWFTTIDLQSGVWQVEMDPKDREKNAFSAGKELWQFTVMPFGLCNSPATFQRLMELVLNGLSWRYCLIYMDDIIVHSKSFEEHLANLSEVFSRLREANLKVNPKKCCFMQREVVFLGHVVSAKGIQTDPEKIKAIKEWPKPNNKTALRSFLGICAYYRKFIRGFSAIARPLHKLTELKTPFLWSDECEEAFSLLKRHLTETPILAYPLTDGEFILDTDASYCSIGAVLSQIQDGEERVIAYYSKTLSKSGRNYCGTRKELVAVTKAVQHFHHYLYGRHFRLRTDHAALTWLKSFKEPEGQMARWIERLCQYDYSCEHRPGIRHRNADGLSRRPCATVGCKHCANLDQVETSTNDMAVEPFCGLLAASSDAIVDAQRKDPDLQIVIRWMENGQRPDFESISHLNEVCK